MRAWTRGAIIALCATVAAVLAAVPSATADRIGEDHLPNLVTRRPLGIRISHEAGAVLLRFSNTVANKGDGPLELRPENTGETTTAFQRVFTHGESGAWVLTSEREVGTFVFHPQHDHWHFEALSEYQRRRVTTSGGVGRVVREAQDKVSFCVADALSTFEGPLHASPTATYPTACAQSAIQGLSVGWPTGTRGGSTASGSASPGYRTGPTG